MNLTLKLAGAGLIALAFAAAVSAVPLVLFWLLVAAVFAAVAAVIAAVVQGVRALIAWVRSDSAVELLEAMGELLD